MTELMPSLCNDCVARNQCGNDDVKMCISYTKETKIKCDDCKFVENCVDYGWKDCKKFTQKASEPMTNEEYLKSCNTEELAIFICNNLPQEIEGTLENRFWSALYSQYPIEPMNAYHEVVKWLKEIHE